MRRLSALRPREASIFACVCDTVVAPEPVLPPVRETDAALFFDRWMARSPRVNRIALRGLLYALELAPLLLGFGARLRRLPPERRAAALDRLEALAPGPLGHVVKLITGMASLAYYGDDAILRRIGYDPDANVARGRELRALEGRP